MTTGVATRRKETPVIQLHQERLRLLPLPVLQKKERLHTFQFDLCWISVWNAVYYFERSSFICILWCAAHAVLSAACQTIYRKNDVPMIFKNEIHKRIFEAEYQKLCKQDARTLAALYLLTAKHSLWISAKIIGKADWQSNPPWKYLYGWVCPSGSDQEIADCRKAWTIWQRSDLGQSFPAHRAGYDRSSAWHLTEQEMRHAMTEQAEASTVQEINHAVRQDKIHKLVRTE